VFGAKIMWPYMAGLADGLSTIPRNDPGMPPAEMLDRTFPGLRYVWLRRMDKVRQAVSLWRAIQTWQWRTDARAKRGDTPGESQLRYSFEAIDHLRRRLIAFDRAWEIYFEGAGIAALTLTYEDFVEDMHRTVARTLDHIGIRYPTDARYGVPGTARQADELSERWIGAFRTDFANAPAVR
jgi:LPS sulfotransferase NodH